MLGFFDLVAKLWTDIWTLFDNVIFYINGLPVSLGGILVCLLIFGLVLSVFWKGAKT